MKRLMIVATLLLATTSTSGWAQAPATDDPHHPPQAVAPAPAQPTPPMANCAGNNGSAMAQDEKTNCPMAPGDMKSDQGAMPMHRMMMQGMMHSQPQPGAKPDQIEGGAPKADKPQ